jgi:hypothetical protein
MPVRLPHLILTVNNIIHPYRPRGSRIPHNSPPVLQSALLLGVRPPHVSLLPPHGTMHDPSALHPSVLAVRNHLRLQISPAEAMGITGQHASKYRTGLHDPERGRDGQTASN